jgi:uncharacterized OB-fold protein
VISVSDEELVERFAGHPLDHDNAAHYRGRLERRLLLNRCADCGVWHHPPRPVCAACWSMDVRPTEVAGTGTIHLVVFVGDPAQPVVTVELDEQPGLRFTSTIVDATADAIRIGARVHLDWVERDDVPLPAFRLDRE